VAKLFNITSEIQQHCGLISKADTFMSSNASDLDAAMNYWCTPVLGSTLLANLVTAYQASIAPTPTAMTSPLKELLPYVQDVVAPLGYLRYLAKNLVTSKDGGLTQAMDAETGRTAVSLWGYNKLSEQLLSDGMQAIDMLYNFLDSSAAGTYAAWESSTAYTQFRDLIIQTTDDFDAQYTINGHRATFVRLKSTMADVEAMDIEDMVSPELMADLKTKIAAKTLSNEEKEFLKSLKKAIAHFTIAKAIVKLSFTMNNGLVAMPLVPREEYGAKMGLKALDKHEIADIKKEARTEAVQWLGRAMNYLNKNASTSLFAAYYNSATYQLNNSIDTWTQNKEDGTVFMMM
jgi:hypothetical protein